MYVTPQQLSFVVRKALDDVKIVDVHTHLFAAEFGGLALYGIDELLTYHYLVAEFFRFSSMEYAAFFELPKTRQADLIWQTLFIDRSPISEAQRGVLTVLNALGLDPKAHSLQEIRNYYATKSIHQLIDIVFELAGVKEVVMTNDPFDPQERKFWETGVGGVDPRFKAAMRIDPLVMDFSNSYKVLQELGYEVDQNLGEKSLAEVKRFLREWIQKMDALYLAVSLPHNFTMANDSLQTRVLKECVLPVCQELGIPFAPMIGVKRGVNKDLRLAGDSLGKADITVIEELCAAYPETKFLVTMLSRENQHELAITARKYRNLLIFGCWWFLNNPSIIYEITSLRFETLGLSFIPQHSDARVLEQLIYKWSHSKKVIGEVLVEKYEDLLATGWRLTEEEITTDIQALFHDNFYEFLDHQS